VCVCVCVRESVMSRSRMIPPPPSPFFTPLPPTPYIHRYLELTAFNASTLNLALSLASSQSPASTTTPYCLSRLEALQQMSEGALSAVHKLLHSFCNLLGSHRSSAAGGAGTGSGAMTERKVMEAAVTEAPEVALSLFRYLAGLGWLGGL
jgi:hypothetical protein